MNTFFFKIFKVILLFISILVVVYQVDFEDVLSKIHVINNGTFILTTALVFLTILLGALRWWDILVSLKVKAIATNIFNVYFASLYTNMIMPGAIGGEALKVWFLHKRGTSYSKAINSVILDRLGAVAATGIITSFFIIYFLIICPYNIKLKFIYILLGSLLISFSIGFLVFYLYKNFKKKRISSFIKKFISDYQMLVRNRRKASAVLIISLLCNCIHGVVFYILTISLYENISIYYCIGLVSIINIICYLPISYAGWGIREITSIYGYSLLGISKDIALIVSVVFGIQLFLVSLPGFISLIKVNERMKVKNNA